jgi:hypothetical protein
MPRILRALARGTSVFRFSLGREIGSHAPLREFAQTRERGKEGFPTPGRLPR